MRAGFSRRERKSSWWRRRGGRAWRRSWRSRRGRGRGWKWSSQKPTPSRRLLFAFPFSLRSVAFLPLPWRFPYSELEGWCRDRHVWRDVAFQPIDNGCGRNPATSVSAPVRKALGHSERRDEPPRLLSTWLLRGHRDRLLGFHSRAEPPQEACQGHLAAGIL